MPKGLRREPCPDCGTTAIRCKKSCPSRGGKPTAAKLRQVDTPASEPLIDEELGPRLRDASDDARLEELARRIRVVAKMREVLAA